MFEQRMAAAPEADAAVEDVVQHIRGDLLGDRHDLVLTVEQVRHVVRRLLA